MKKYIVVFITCSSRREALKIAKALVNKKAVACANIVGGIHSLYWWKGKVDEAKEVLLIAKTLQKNFTDVRKTVTRLHSYEVPEIIALPISMGEDKYMRWIGQSLK